MPMSARRAGRVRPGRRPAATVPGRLYATWRASTRLAGRLSACPERAAREPALFSGGEYPSAGEEGVGDARFDGGKVVHAVGLIAPLGERLLWRSDGEPEDGDVLGLRLGPQARGLFR